MVNAKEFWMKEGEKRGEKRCEKRGIEEVVILMREMNRSLEDIIDRLQKRFQLSRREAMRQAKKAMA